MRTTEGFRAQHRARGGPDGAGPGKQNEVLGLGRYVKAPAGMAETRAGLVAAALPFWGAPAPQPPLLPAGDATREHDLTGGI